MVVVATKTTPIRTISIRMLRETWVVVTGASAKQPCGVSPLLMFGRCPSVRCYPSQPPVPRSLFLQPSIFLEAGILISVEKI